MKKGLFAVLMLILAFSGGISCLGGSNKIQYQLRLEKGKTYTIRVVTDQKISQTVQGQQQDIKQTIEIKYTFDVEDVDSDGNTTVKVTYQSIRFSQVGPRGEVEYDSSNPSPNIPPEATGLATLVGKSITVKLTPNGQVKEIKGVDEMIASMIKELNIPEDMKSSMEKSLKEQFGDEALKEMMESNVIEYPKKSVASGDTWSNKVTVSKGFPMVLENTWKLKERKNGISVIEVSSTIESNTEAEPIKIDSMKISYKLSGWQKGTMEVQEATGLTKQGQLNQEFSGELRVEGAPQTSKVQTWPIKVESRISFELLE
jgi:hypothetical protein